MRRRPGRPEIGQLRFQHSTASRIVAPPAKSSTHIAGRRVARLEADGQQLQHGVAAVAVDADRLHLFDAREMQRRAAALVVALPPASRSAPSPRRSGSSRTTKRFSRAQPARCPPTFRTASWHMRGEDGEIFRVERDQAQGGRRPAWLIRRRCMPDLVGRRRAEGKARRAAVQPRRRSISAPQAESFSSSRSKPRSR